MWNFFDITRVVKVAQMERFVDDLQAVLDICFNNVYGGREKEDEKETKE